MDIFVLQTWEYERNAFADGLPASDLTSHATWESAVRYAWRTVVMPRYADLMDVFESFVSQDEDTRDLELEDMENEDVFLLEKAINFYYEWANDEQVNAGWAITCLPSCSLEDALRAANELSVNGRTVSQWGHDLDGGDDEVLYYRHVTVDHVLYEDSFDRDDLDSAVYIGAGIWRLPDGTRIKPLNAQHF